MDEAKAEIRGLSSVMSTAQEIAFAFTGKNKSLERLLELQIHSLADIKEKVDHAVTVYLQDLKETGALTQDEAEELRNHFRYLED
jgi:hypothetical protein